jgi:diaminopimelate decarboxylase
VRRAIRLEVVRPPAFAYKRPTGKLASLFCDEVDLTRLAERHGTPLHVYSALAIRNRIRAFHDAFRSIPNTICYSVKANSTLGILRLVAENGCGFDIVSGGELERVLRVERRVAARVVFSGVGKTRPEMESALKAGILLFNVESASELEALASVAKQLKKIAPIAIRVNPDVSAKTHPYISTGLHEHKFGVPIATARKLYAEAAKHSNLQVAGVSVHIGSQITDLSSFSDALERAAELVEELRGAGHDIRYVDAGGGLGIPYHGTKQPFAEVVRAYANAVLRSIKPLGVHLLLEPGRSIVGPAGVLITRVIYRKRNDSKKFLIVDAGMNDLLRPALYSAFHQIVPLTPSRAKSSSKGSLGKTEITDVVGPICETGDFFARDRELPVMQEGDLLAILDTGAYGAVLSSNYNSRGRAAEVLVDGTKALVIRKRETAAHQMYLES